jgi:plastocyanin
LRWTITRPPTSAVVDTSADTRGSLVNLRPASLILVTAALAAACASPGETTSSDMQVSHQAHPDADVVIDTSTFAPSTLLVSVGETVTWVNHHDFLHTVTSKLRGKGAGGVRFDHRLKRDETFSFYFERAGTFAYHCTIHLEMRGQDRRRVSRLLGYVLLASRPLADDPC